MINLKRYEFKTLQNVLTVLDQYNNDGVVLIEEARKDLRLFILSKLDNRQEIIRNDRIALKKNTCPSCSLSFLVPVNNPESLNIWACKKCRYSEIKEKE